MDGMMKAAIFDGSDKLCIKSVSVPKISSDDDVLIRVQVASICGTDLHILSSKGFGGLVPLDTILGHEYVGEIVKVGSSVEHLKVGDVVVISNNVPCGYCSYCQMNMPNMCLNMRSLGVKENGGFAEYSLVPVKALFPIPQGLSIDKVIFTEPLSCVINAISKIKINPGMPTAVLGAGPIGQMFIRLLRFMGVGKIIVSEPAEFRAKLALKSGADRVLNPNKDDIEKQVKAETELGVDLVIDAVGTLFDIALNVVRAGGTIILFGLAKDFKGENLISQTDIMLREIIIRGNYISDYAFPKALQVLSQGNLQVEDLISDRVELNEINTGISRLREGRSVKVLVKP